MRKVRKRLCPRNEANRERKAIPGQGAHHQESTVLPSGGKGRRDNEKALLRWTERSGTHSKKDPKDRVTELANINRKMFNKY